MLVVQRNTKRLALTITISFSQFLFGCHENTSVRDNKNQRGKKYELTELERRKLSVLFEGVNLEKSFTVDGKQVRSSLATGLIHVNEVFQLNRLEKVQNNVELIFRPYLQKQVLKFGRMPGIIIYSQRSLINATRIWRATRSIYKKWNRQLAIY